MYLVPIHILDEDTHNPVLRAVGVNTHKYEFRRQLRSLTAGVDYILML